MSKYGKEFLNKAYGTVYSDTDSAISKMVTELHVSDVMRFTEDNQRVLITDKESYSIEDSLFFGEMQNIPHRLYDLMVSKYYSDYVYSENYTGSFIGIRIINPAE